MLQLLLWPVNFCFIKQPLSSLCLSILAHHLFLELTSIWRFQRQKILDSRKGAALRHHSGSPRQAFAHCEGFAPAASRRTCTHVSECISGLSLSRPVVIIGLLGSYPNNDLITRSPILRYIAAFSDEAFQHTSLIGFCSQFPGVIPVLRAG